ncbi:Glycosyltransferase, GT2 family [Ectothiorhodospira magna]|uniref:Glycosyltransferase, GT2 family n=1 Tax=Ectothiorhodospira magna TaxID=867345 RepID=A0A1H9BJG8_9GAMM|nr:glycosyltransferase [Ectothiorhodospira magna]SEP89142.1 Glycosyltransferase, GT2 family [Ectothiorhodospira magna]
MVTEDHYLPFGVGDLPSGHWLVLAPHADDETFGMGGAIIRAREAGTAVSVIILTDGAQGGSGTDLVQAREQEARTAAEQLGGLELDFWRCPDRGLVADEALIQRLTQYIEDQGYSAVFFPMPGEPHPDHRATAHLAWEALRRCRFAPIPIGYEISVQGLTNCLVDISSVVERKTRVMAVYQSQQGENAYTERVLALNQSRTWSLPRSVSHAEAFFLWPRRDSPLLDVWAEQLLPRLAPAALARNRPLVSVIIRTRNRQTLLEQAIRSVAAQTWPRLELVVVNDGGTEVATEVAAAQGGVIQQVRYLSLTDHPGRSAAANRGMEAATGTLLMFLDDDDWLLPGHVAGLVQALEQTPEAIGAYSNVSAVRREGEHWVEVRRFSAPFDPARFAYENYLPIHSVLFHRRIMEQGCRFPETLDVYEDWAFWTLVTGQGVLIHVDQTTACYRIYDNSGFGVHADPERVNRSLVPFVQWARTHWSDEHLSILVRRASAMAEIQRREQAMIADLDRQAGEQAATLSAHRQEIRVRDERIVQQDVRIATLDDTLSRQQAELTALQGQLAALQGQLALLHASRSWRLTAPLRLLGRLARRTRDMARAGHPLLRRHGWRGLLDRGWHVLRREGITGLKARLHHHATLNAHIPRSAPPCQGQAALAWEPDPGHYRLVEGGGNYVYVPPRRPAHLDAWLTTLKAPPRFSIVVPVYNTPPILLQALLDSVTAQWYPHWELILADDASPSTETRQALTRISDGRVKVLHLDTNQGIAGATNAAIAAAGGEFVVFLDHDDELTPDCLYELALCIQREQPDFIYSDEDKITPQGHFTEPHFKPDWSPDTIMSTMYTCHVSCIRRTLLARIGGLRSEYDGCQDWDLILRVAERTDRISHVPKVLYHWRILPASVASDLAAKPYVLAASKKAREDALQRRGLFGELEPVPGFPAYCRVRYHLRGNPLVSIIIPTRDNPAVLRRCIDALPPPSNQSQYEILIMDNGSVTPEARRYLDTLPTRHPHIRVLRHDAPFNFSELNNLAVQASRGDLLLFLNDDTEVITPDWLERLGGYAQLPHVGAVGAKLLYPGGHTIQHAGLVNLQAGPGHAFLHRPADHPGYFMRNLLEYNWLAVTGACLMISREKFMRVGGFDETFPIAYNDVELCIRLHEAGLYNLVCPAVSLIHHESVSRGPDHLDPAKRERLRGELRRLYALHPRYFQHDPFHNPNLHPDSVHFDLAC